MSRIRSLIEEWFKSPEEFGNGFVIMGFVLIGLGNFLSVALFLNLGFALLGAGIVAWGVNAIQSRELTVLQSDIRFSQRIQELVARAWGILIIGGGVLLLGYGVLSVLNPRSPLPARVQQFFTTAEGAALVALSGSLVGIVFALSMIFANDATGNVVVRTLKSLPSRLFGIVLFILCGTLATATILQIFAPGIWDNLAHAFLQWAGLE